MAARHSSDCSSSSNWPHARMPVVCLQLDSPTHSHSLYLPQAMFASRLNGSQFRVRVMQGHIPQGHERFACRRSHGQLPLAVSAPHFSATDNLRGVERAASQGCSLPAVRSLDAICNPSIKKSHHQTRAAECVRAKMIQINRLVPGISGISQRELPRRHVALMSALGWTPGVVPASLPKRQVG